MQSEALTTLTARYSLREDRIFVDGVIHTGDELKLAFTRRLVRALAFHQKVSNTLILLIVPLRSSL